MALEGNITLEDGRLLGCCLVDIESSSEMSVDIYQTTWCCMPEDSHLHIHFHENLKTHKITLVHKYKVIKWRQKFLGEISGSHGSEYEDDISEVLAASIASIIRAVITANCISYEIHGI
jgi:hypothetical protein